MDDPCSPCSPPARCQRCAGGYHRLCAGQLSGDNGCCHITITLIENILADFGESTGRALGPSRAHALRYYL